MKPYISVVIPTLNEEKYLPKLLQDLVKQKEQDFEVIVADGNSEDKTKDIVKNYQKQLNLKIVISDKRNLAYQRNLGAKHSQGQYVLFLDADTHIIANFLRKLRKHIEKDQYLLFLPRHAPHGSTYQDEIIYNVMNFFIELSHVTDKPFAYGPSMAFSRDFFLLLGGFNEEVFVYEDHEIVQRAFQRGVKAKLLQDIEVKFSLRRYQKEGRFNVLRKYLIALRHQLLKGKVTDHNIFEYEMGGKAKYLTMGKKESFNEVFAKNFKKLKQLLEE